MTWAELHDVLRDRGLVTGDTRAPARGVVNDITGIAYDSRRVERGNVFVALKGEHADGTRFATQAAERGAVAVISEEDPSPGLDIAWTKVGDARQSLAYLAAAFHHHPSEAMRLVGITGTNGKTTTAYVMNAVFEAAGIRCGMLGTVAYKIGGDLREATRTTPEAPDVQGLLREMVDVGCEACVMEVSSHALALRRVDALTFAAGVFTNLTRDHLDFHADMDAYFRAKQRLFELLPPGAPSVINLDDPRGRALVDRVTTPVTYAVNRAADVTPGPLTFSLEGLAFEIRTPRGVIPIRSALVGRPNVYNILAAAATATALDLPLQAIECGVQSLTGVPGRFELVSGPTDDITVVVDYAHTDDALRNLLETARPLAKGRLVTVFGCGGDRDRTKRPLMGAVAGRLSDVIVLTSDNPRSEDPGRIIEEVRRGLTPDTWKSDGQRLLTIIDRREAIEAAIELARPGDLVLIAGKGHEKYQVIGDRVRPFDDVVVAREALMRRRASGAV